MTDKMSTQYMRWSKECLVAEIIRFEAELKKAWDAVDEIKLHWCPGPDKCPVYADSPAPQKSTTKKVKE